MSAPVDEVVSDPVPVEAPVSEAPSAEAPKSFSLTAEELQNLIQSAVKAAVTQVNASNPMLGVQQVKEDAPPLSTTQHETAQNPDGQSYPLSAGGAISVESNEDGEATTVLTTSNGSRRQVPGDIHEIAVKLAHLFGF